MLNKAIKLSFIFIVLFLSSPFVFSVNSGSMEPKIKTGSLVFVKPQQQYFVGDVITYNNEIKNSTSTHRVVELMDNLTVRVKGDSNYTSDVRPIIKKNIIGKVFFTIPMLGYLSIFLKTQIGFILFIIIPATVIVYSEILKIKNYFKKK